MTSTIHVIPTYRALTVAGIVLEKDEMGEVHHALVTDTTLPVAVEMVYHVK